MIVDLRPIFRALPHFTRRFMPYDWYGEEWWNLNTELGKWIVPHLKAMREHGTGCPGNWIDDGEEKWSAILDEMIAGLELLAEGDTSAAPLRDKVQRAFDLLAEYWPSLWV